MFRAYPSSFLLIAVIGGIIIADLAHIGALVYFILALVALVSALWMKNSKREIIAILLGVSILFGSAFHFDVRYLQRGPYDVEQLADGQTRQHIYGQVDNWPTIKTNRTECIISVDSISGQFGRPVVGKLLLRLSTETTSLQRGDGIEFYARIYPLRPSSLPGQFDYQRFMNLKEVHGTVYLPTLIDIRVDRRNRYGVIHLIDQLRDMIRESLYRNLDPTSAALSAGFLIGETHDIPERIYKLFRDTGTFHLLAVSGSNVALILLFIVWLMRPFALSKKWRTFILLFTIFLFSLLSYNEPSVLRASVMATLVIFAALVQRRYDLNNILMLAGSIILIIVPSQLYDVGFQLSFITAWGLIIATPLLHGQFKRYHTNRWYKWLALPFLIAITAQLFSTPIIAYYFGVVPVVSVLANLVIVPIVSFAVVGILILLSAHIILPSLGLFVGGVMNMILQFVLYLLEMFGGDSPPVINTGHVELWVIFVAYGLLLSIIFGLRYTYARRIVVWIIVLSLQVVLIGVVVDSAGATTEPEISTTKVPGGYISLLTPANSSDAVLVISGLSRREYDIGERIIAPFVRALGVARIPRMIVFSADFDMIDDLLKLSQPMGIDSIFVAGKLYGSFRQVADQQIESGLAHIIKLPSALPDLGGNNRLSVSSSGIVLIQDSVKIAMVSELTESFCNQVKISDLRCLFLNRFTSESATLLSIVDSTRDLSIICSYSAQESLKAVSDENILVGSGKLQIFDLSKESPLTVRLEPERADRVHISCLQ